MSSEVASVESRWLKGNDTDHRASPDVDGMPIEEYQQSIAKMNDSLHDIQTDIARLVTQQNQLQNQHFIQHQQQNQMNHSNQHISHNQSNQYQHQQNQYNNQHINQNLNQHSNQQQQVFQHQYQQPQQQNIPQLHNQYSSQHNISSGPRHGPLINASFGSTPHIPHAQRQDYHFHQPEQNYQQYQPHENYSPAYQRQVYQPQESMSQVYQQEGVEQGYQRQESVEQSPRQFYLHESGPPVQRRTWAQQAQAQHDNQQRGWQLHQQSQQSPQQTPQYHPPHHEPRTWKSPSPQPPDNRWHPQPFHLADRSQQAFPVHYNHDRYQNGDQQNHLSYTVVSPSPAHHPSASPPLTSSPQRRSKTPQRQGSLPEPIRRQESVSLQQLSKAPVPAPTVDDMEPQNISFIGNAEDDALEHGISRLNISSGKRTYRIPSPTRPHLNRNSFQQQTRESSHSDASGDGGETNEKGFYISFDNDQPKRPKPPLRSKRGSPRKERTPTEYQSPDLESPDDASPWQDRVPEPFVVHQNASGVHAQREMREEMSYRQTPPRERLREGSTEPAAIVIEDKVDPNSAEEMEKKKERIMLLSLQRRARAEESRSRAEQAAAARRARDEQLAEQRAAKKEEQARRREAILAQHKFKKAIEEAEREGKVIDKAELMASLGVGSAGVAGGSPSAPAGARLRNKAGAGARARPKTIHVDSGAVEAAGLMGRKQASSTNLTAYGGGSTMRRDYYRGSQDSLADRAGLYRDSPCEESGGMSPGAGSTSSSVLGRRGSYRTSREREEDARGRSKYLPCQNNLKAGRKSSSLMNLCDSGLGRATPPRRAASPGARLLPSPGARLPPPSGPGSLPGGIGKRARHIDDNASDISSTHSSIMDYSGPRLYKQPATKSNRGIMLNAVEYCVFPGAVNREAKRRVLEEIARSESKHFLVLFRDAGCQFRALYSFCPDTDNVTKLYGTGPRQVNDRMFDKFFKYNSGSKCFSQIHTKHLTVTIDAFTIHNSLWQGKKVNLPSKKDMALVI